MEWRCSVLPLASTNCSRAHYQANDYIFHCPASIVQQPRDVPSWRFKSASTSQVAKLLRGALKHITHRFVLVDNGYWTRAWPWTVYVEFCGMSHPQYRAPFPSIAASSANKLIPITYSHSPGRSHLPWTGSQPGLQMACSQLLPCHPARHTFSPFTPHV